MATQVPHVSVIIPTHNRSRLLARAMRSVLAQNYRDFELLIVDDCSKDDTADVVHAFNDARIRYIRLDTNQRAARARNVGIAQARGELVAFQDDDDIWLIDKLGRQVQAMLADPDVGLNISGYVADYGGHAEPVFGQERFEAMDFDRGPLEGFGLIATPGWLVRKSCLEQAGGFDPQMRSWDDWELAYRLSKLCRFSHLPEPLFIQDRRQGGGMWNLVGAYPGDMERILEKHGADWQSAPQTLARFHCLAAQYHALQGRTREARQHIRQALALVPGYRRAWVLTALVWLGPTALQSLMQLHRSMRRVVRGNFSPIADH